MMDLFIASHLNHHLQQTCFSFEKEKAGSLSLVSKGSGKPNEKSGTKHTENRKVFVYPGSPASVRFHSSLDNPLTGGHL